MVTVNELWNSWDVIIHNGPFAECEVLDNFRGLCNPGTKTRTYKLVLGDPREQGLTSRTTTAVLLTVCMSYAAVKRRQERAFCGLALRHTSTDKVHHVEHQCRPASDRRLWSGIDSELSMREHVSRIARTGFPPAQSTLYLSTTRQRCVCTTRLSPRTTCTTATLFLPVFQRQHWHHYWEPTQVSRRTTSPNKRSILLHITLGFLSV